MFVPVFSSIFVPGIVYGFVTTRFNATSGGYFLNVSEIVKEKNHYIPYWLHWITLLRYVNTIFITTLIHLNIIINRSFLESFSNFYIKTHTLCSFFARKIFSIIIYFIKNVIKLFHWFILIECIWTFQKCEFGIQTLIPKIFFQMKIL